MADVTTDQELIERYVIGRNQAAFAELVRRHSGWVYGCARRMVRDEALAQDITQAVFLLLTQRAKSIRGKRHVAGWLFRATQFCARAALRGKARREKHEREAAMQKQLFGQQEREANWEEIWPILDDAVARLGRTDRDAVLLRFYRGMSFAEVGTAIGTGEEAAKKRVQRAVEKLRKILHREGVGASGLEVVIGEKLVGGGPSDLAFSPADVGPAGGIAKGAAKMMAWAPVKVAALLVTAAVSASGVGMWALAGDAPKEAAAVAERTNMQQDQSVADVVAAFEAAEARFTSLRLSYTEDVPRWDGRTLVGRAVQKRIMAFKRPEGWIYQWTQTLSDDLPNGELGTDTMAAFDGTVTRDVELTPRRDGPINRYQLGTVKAGRDDPRLNVLNPTKDLHYRIFHFGAWPLSAFDLRVVDQGEQLDGIPTIHLQGTAKDGGGDFEVWLAREHGMIPVKWTYFFHKAEEGLEMRMTSTTADLRDLGNGMWYPTTVSRTSTHKSNVDAERTGTESWRVDEVSTAPLDITFFQPDFPPGTRVTDFANNRTYTAMASTTSRPAK